MHVLTLFQNCSISPLKSFFKNLKNEDFRFSKLKIDHIFASPFDRTIETACIVAKPHGIDVKVRKLKRIISQKLKFQPEPGLCEALYLCESPPSFWDAEKLAEKFQTIDLDYVPVYSKVKLFTNFFGKQI